MDIEEIKKYSKNKIEADDLTKQVRQRIKETAWEKQNRREGFTETFKPLISQFEKPEDSKENIFTQNQKMLQNQLALTEGLKDNQKAITKGFEQFERLADMKELPKLEYDGYDGYDSYYEKEQEKAKKKPKFYNIEKNFDEKEIKAVEEYGHPRPINFERFSDEELDFYFKNVTDNIKILTASLNGRGNKENPDESYLQETELLEFEKKALKKYQKAIKDYQTSRSYQLGEGIMSYYSPQELIKRFELLGGSLAAGNNGVLPEYIQIAHRLRDLGIVTNKQLNTLLRKII